MSVFLLDANVLIALTVVEHEHHERAVTWFAGIDRFALCPIVEGALVRFLLRLGESADVAQRVLIGVHQHPKAEFWPDAVSYADCNLSEVRGHRQVTDAYLLSLARSIPDGMLATMDEGLAALGDRALLLPA